MMKGAFAFVFLFTSAAWAQAPATQAAKPPETSDVGCPFKPESAETTDLGAKAEQALQTLAQAQGKCEVLEKGVKDLQEAVNHLRAVQTNEPEAGAEIQFQMALRRYKRGLPIDSPGAEPYVACVGRFPADQRANIENCMVEQYALKIQQLRDDAALKNQATVQSQSQGTINANITLVSDRLTQLITSTANNKACKQDPIVVSAVLGAATQLSNYMAGSFPGATYFGVGIAGSISALTALVADMFADHTVEKLLAGIKDDRDFSNYACLYMAVQDRMLRCSSVQPQALTFGNLKPAPVLSNPFVEEVLSTELPDPKHPGHKLKVMDYLTLVKADLQHANQVEGAARTGRGRTSMANEQKKYIDAIDRLQKAFEQVQGGNLDENSPEGKVKYAELNAAQTSFNEIFSKEVAADNKGWATYVYNDKLNLKGLLAFHKKRMDQIHERSSIANLEWYVDSMDAAKTAYNNFFARSLAADRTDRDEERMGKINTEMVIAFRSKFVQKLQDAGEMLENSCRNHSWGRVLPILRLCSLTAGMYYLNPDPSKVSPNGLHSDSSILTSKSYYEMCSRFRCAAGLPNPRVPAEVLKRGYEMNRREREEIKSYVCELSQSYPRVVNALRAEYDRTRGNETICGRSVCDLAEEFHKRNKH